ncbi:unnamed protein product [Paramecium primaurelia]|uniref:Uncharacterized protein n=1 Tax=Paramecium primaurelia TaxID=5886 RepID=A0A8S1KQC3_PARPR|nr:unnamed protein product [Paramecium primaurelia]
MKLLFYLLELCHLELIISDLFRDFFYLQSNEEDLELISLLLIITEALYFGQSYSFYLILKPYSSFQVQFYYIEHFLINCSSF